MQRVAPEYYKWSLEQRRSGRLRPIFFEGLTFLCRKALGGYSQHHLCKSIIVENTLWDAQHAKIPPGADPECGDPTFSKFYMIIIQYTTRLMSHKVFKYMRGLRPDVTKRVRLLTDLLQQSYTLHIVVSFQSSQAGGCCEIERERFQRSLSCWQSSSRAHCRVAPNTRSQACIYLARWRRGGFETRILDGGVCEEALSPRR